MSKNDENEMNDEMMNELDDVKMRKNVILNDDDLSLNRIERINQIRGRESDVISWEVVNDVSV
jgi:hypothetical protein